MMMMMAVLVLVLVSRRIRYRHLVWTPRLPPRDWLAIGWNCSG